MAITIGRRKFITLLGGAAATLPLTARAQQPAMPVVGYLGSGWPDLDAYLVRAFRQGLSETGYVEGRNVMIEYRWADGQDDRLPALAADLVRRRVTVIAATGAGVSVQVAKAASTTIPIVFVSSLDPIQTGLIASLNRPGGNLTGVTTLGAELGPKRLELLHELVPTATVIGFLVAPTNPNAETMQAAARSLGLRILFLPARTERDFDAVFASLVQQRAGGLVIGAYGLFVSRSEQLAALALRHAVARHQHRTPKPCAVKTSVREHAGSGCVMQSMPQPLVISIPHSLGKEEALRRLKSGLASAQSQFRQLFTVQEEIWSGDRLQFRVAALAQTARGIIDVADDHIRLEIELPWLLAKIAQQIQRVVNAQGALMLEKK